jgi:hypothetical protein
MELSLFVPLRLLCPFTLGDVVIQGEMTSAVGAGFDWPSTVFQPPLFALGRRADVTLKTIGGCSPRFRDCLAKSVPIINDRSEVFDEQVTLEGPDEPVWVNTEEPFDGPVSPDDAGLRIV